MPSGEVTDWCQRSVLHEETLLPTMHNQKNHLRVDECRMLHPMYSPRKNLLAHLVQQLTVLHIFSDASQSMLPPHILHELQNGYGVGLFLFGDRKALAATNRRLL
jgi:hypothetical protein